MPSVEGIQTPLPQSAFARLATAARYAITGVAPTTWFGPQQPLAPMAPPEVKGRQFDYTIAGLSLSQLTIAFFDKSGAPVVANGVTIIVEGY
jgi:hypothetical protein